MTWSCSAYGAGTASSTNDYTISWNLLLAKSLRDSAASGYTSFGQASFKAVGTYSKKLLGFVFSSATLGSFANNTDTVYFAPNTLAAPTANGWTDGVNHLFNTLVGGEVPSGYRWNTSYTNTNVPNNVTANKCYAVIDAHNGTMTPGQMGVIGVTSALSVFGDTTKDAVISSLGPTTSANAASADFSFMYVPANLTAIKVNKEFAKMVMYAAFAFDLSAFKYRWMGPAAGSQDLTVKIYDGVFANIDADAAPLGNLLATFTVETDHFSSPDVYGKFYMTGAKTVNASATGTATYAMLEGYHSDTANKPRMFVPLTTIAADNFVALDSLSLNSGSPVTMYDLGFKFAMGT